MKRHLAPFALLVALTLAACGGGGSGATPADDSGLLAPANVPPQLRIADWGQGTMNGAIYAGPVSGAALHAIVVVHQQNAQGLAQYAKMANDPTSPDYRHWLTPQQIGQMFGASTADYQKAANYFVSNGLSVAGWPQHLVLIVSGRQTNMEKAFGTTFGLYQLDGKSFIAPRVAPHFEVQLPVDSVGGIVAYHPDHTYLLRSGQAVAGYATGFSASTVRNAFDYTGAFSAGYEGSGITIGIVGTGAIDTTTTGSGDNDLNMLASLTNANPVAPVTERLVTTSGVSAGLNASPTPISPSAFPYTGAFTATPGPSGGHSWGYSNEDGEAQLDTQQAATLAPQSNVYFYFGYNTNDGCTGASFASPCPTSGPNAGSIEFGLQESDAEIEQAISENAADVLSLSYGGGDTQQGWTCNTGCASPYAGSYSQLEFAALAAEGVAVFASSGDSGSAECFGNSTYLPKPCVSYPAGDPNVTSVGGITANVDGTGAPTAPWLAWGISTSETGYGASQGSGGGTAAFLPAPTWQQNDLGTTLREQPDVSLIGDPSTGVSAVTQGQISGIGGTSVAAPEMAAMWADVLSACKNAYAGAGACPPSSGGAHWYRMGNPSQYLYAIWKHQTITTSTGVSWLSTLPYTSVFYDIVYGDNQMDSNPGAATPEPGIPVAGYAAGPGYDEVTGVGVPYAGHLIDALFNATVP